MIFSNRSGYLRTLEAIIAAVLVLIFIFTLLPRREISSPETPYVVQSSQEFILNQILVNDTLRGCVVSDPLCENSDAMRQLILDNLPPGYTYGFKICDTTNCLISTSPDKSVFVADVLLSADLASQNPKVFRLWLWEGE